MITFKIKPKISDYLYSTFLRFKYGRWKIALKFALFFYFVVLLISFSSYKYFGQPGIESQILPIILVAVVTFVTFFPMVLAIFISVEFIFPILKYLLTKFYYKAEYIEYFFGKSEFGWEVLGNKLSYKTELIKSIIPYRDHFVMNISLKNAKLVFLATKTTISALKKSTYKKYFTN